MQLERLLGILLQDTGGARFGRVDKPRGSMKVQPVGPYWGVFDYDPQPGVRYITIAKGKKQGKRLWG